MRNLLSGIFIRLGVWIISVGAFIHSRETQDVTGEKMSESEFTELQRQQNRLMFTGSCFHISNLCAHPAANKDYYVAALRNAQDETRTDVYMFTEKELIRAQDRADKNREDIPEDIGDFDLHVQRTED